MRWFSEGANVGVMIARVAALVSSFAALLPAQPVSRLIYSAYLNPVLSSGSSLALDGTAAYAAAADPAGNVVLSTSSYNGSLAISAVLVKIGPDGSTRFSTTIPNANAIAVTTDANSNIYVCGRAGLGFQTTPGVFLPYAYAAGFVAKLDPAGTLLWASQISAFPSALAVDGSGNIYLTGTADTRNINGISFQPTPGAVQSVAKGQNAFIAKVSTDGRRLLYATFLGGTGPPADLLVTGFSGDVGNAIAVGPSGRVYVVGETGSSDFPVTQNAYQPIYGGRVLSYTSPIFVVGPAIVGYAGGDAFFSELDLSTGTLVYSTYLGGAGVDFADGVAVDASGNVFITGTTNSTGFPVTRNAAQSTFAASPKPMGRAGNSFFAEFDSNDDPVYISYHGVTGTEVAAGAVLDPMGRLYFLEDQTASTNACTPPVSVIAVDTRTGTVAGQEPVPGLGLNPYMGGSAAILGLGSLPVPATLTVDAGGIVTASGIGGGDQIQFLPAGSKRSAAGWLIGRIDFSLQDELVPWCVANAASYSLEPNGYFGGTLVNTAQGFVGPAQYIAPGEIISIFGLGVGPSATVSIGAGFPPFTPPKFPLTILYSDANQVNAVVPYDLPVGPSHMTIQRGAYSVSFPITVLPLFPGVFTTDGGVRQVAINEDGTVNSGANPARGGSTISFFATGLGPLDSTGKPVIPIHVVDTSEILSVIHPASLPAGVFQITVRVPSIASNPAGATEGVSFYLDYGSPWFQYSSPDPIVYVLTTGTN